MGRKFKGFLSFLLLIGFGALALFVKANEEKLAHASGVFVGAVLASIGLALVALPLPKSHNLIHDTLVGKIMIFIGAILLLLGLALAVSASQTLAAM